jgi:F0F1-type ATP synthase membrane subunit b/b'
MSSRPNWVFLGVVCAIVLAAPLAAAEGSDAASAPIGWVFRWLNFLLVFGGGGYLLAKYTPALFRRRADKIAAGILEATRAREAAEARLREAEEKLQGLEQEKASLREAARHGSAAEAERIQGLARHEAQKVERAAQAEIEAAERAARIELKSLAARLAVERAEALLREQLTPQTEAGLFRYFVESLARSVN